MKEKMEVHMWHIWVLLGFIVVLQIVFGIHQHTENELWTAQNTISEGLNDINKVQITLDEKILNIMIEQDNRITQLEQQMNETK